VKSVTWIKRRHSVLSKIMPFSNSFISRSFLTIFLGLPTPLVIRLPSIWFTLLATESTILLSTCSNYPSLISIIFSTIGVIQLFLMSSFLILSHLVIPHIQRNIIISATLLLCIRVGSSPPYTLSRTTSSDLQFSDKKFPFNLSGTFASHKTHEALLYFNHPTWTQWFTPPSISPYNFVL